MTCKGCTQRRTAVKAWIRKLIGVDVLVDGQYTAQRNYVDSEIKSLRNYCNSLDERVLALTEAGAQLEEAIGTLDNGVVTITTDMRERLDAIRSTIHGQRAEFRIVSDRVNDQAGALKLVSDRVEKVEFPGFTPVSKD